MEFDAVLRKRRMCRRFTGEGISGNQADRIAAAALRSPTAGNSQGITVVSVTDRDTISLIAAACGEPEHVARGFHPWLSTAAQHVVLCAEPQRYRARYAEFDKDPEVLEAIPWWWVDAGAALMAVLLAAENEDLGAGFHGGHRADGIRSILEIPAGVLIAGIVTIGHPAPHPRSQSVKRLRRTDAVRRDRW